MIFGGRAEDDDYHRWFAWRPVWLNGPMEWDRKRALGSSARWVWLRTIYRMRSRFGTYYAVPE